MFAKLRRLAQLRQPEVEDFRRPMPGQENVSGLDVPVNDALVMGGLKPVADLNGDVEQFCER